MVRLDDNDVLREGAGDKPARCVLERRRGAVENSAKFVQQEDAQRCAGDSDDALGTLLRAERGGPLEGFKSFVNKLIKKMKKKSHTKEAQGGRALGRDS